MNVHVGNLKTLEHHAYPCGIKRLSHPQSDVAGNAKNVAGQLLTEIHPLINGLSGHDEGMPRRQRLHCEKRHTLVVGPHEPSRQFSGNDAAEDSTHSKTLTHSCPDLRNTSCA